MLTLITAISVPSNALLMGSTSWPGTNMPKQLPHQILRWKALGALRSQLSEGEACGEFLSLESFSFAKWIPCKVVTWHSWHRVIDLDLIVCQMPPLPPVLPGLVLHDGYLEVQCSVRENRGGDRGQ